MSLIFWLRGSLDLCLYIYKSRSVRSSVTAYLKNRSEDFSETWYEVGGQKYKNRHTAAFFIKNHVFSKTAHLCENKPFLAIFGCFWDFVKKPLQGYFLILPKCARKCYLLHRIIFSPVKINFGRFWPILAQNIDVRGQIWRHFGLSFRVREGLLGGGGL